MNLLEKAMNTVWLMKPEALNELINVLYLREHDEEAYSQLVNPSRAKRKQLNDEKTLTEMIDDNGIFSLAISEKMINKGDSVNSESGTQSYTGIKNALNFANNNENVKGIFLQMDSPGGQVNGVKEVLNTIKGIQKPIISYTENGSYSASEHLRVGVPYSFASDHAGFGSIGVYSYHIDQTEKLQKAGIKPTFFSAGKHKLDGSSMITPTERFFKERQDTVNSAYNDFKEVIASNRNLDLSKADDLYDSTGNLINDGWAEGKVFTAKEALSRGLIDRIGNRDTAYQYLQDLIETGQPVSQAQTPTQLIEMNVELENKETALQAENEALKLKLEQMEKEKKQELLCKINECKPLTESEKAIYGKCSIDEMQAVYNELSVKKEEEKPPAPAPLKLVSGVVSVKAEDSVDEKLKADQAFALSVAHQAVETLSRQFGGLK